MHVKVPHFVLDLILRHHPADILEVYDDETMGMHKLVCETHRNDQLTTSLISLGKGALLNYALSLLIADCVLCGNSLSSVTNFREEKAIF